MRQVFTGDLIWADGTTDHFPPIHRASSGWWYKPDEAITDHRKTFGMGHTGSNIAQQWHEKLFTKAIQGRREEPVRIGRPLNNLSAHSRGVSVTWTNPIYGKVQIALEISVSWNGVIANYKLTCHPAAEFFAKLLEDPRSHWQNVWCREVTTYTQTHQLQRDDIEKVLNSWMKDPWGRTRANLAKTQQLEKVLRVPELSPLEEWPNEPTEIDGVTYLFPSGFNRWIGIKAQSKVAENLDQLRALGEALQYWGTEMQIHTTWEGNQKVLTGITFIVPSGGKHNEEGHQIRISPTGPVVECGYVKNEQRYHQYEKQRAKALLQELDTETFEEFEF